ncbi:cobaltochelatase subunit CobN [Methanimicrococcus hacksteinii]|nr:cobaltochelatase subunit CobN [Methanimicrococcus sp. At1]
MSSTVVYAEPVDSSPEIKILYVGIDNHNPDGSTSEGTVHKYWKYFMDPSSTTNSYGQSYFDPKPEGFENIVFDFVLAYAPDYSPSSELKMLADNDEFKNYDVIVFDMVSFYESDISIENALTNADKEGTVLIALRGTDILPNLFQTDEVLDRIVSWDLNLVDDFDSHLSGMMRWSDSFTLTSVFVREVIKYSDKSKDLKNIKPLNILYIGYDLKADDEAVDNSEIIMGATHFDAIVKKIEKTVFSDAINIDSASYGIFSTSICDRGYSYADVETNKENWSVDNFRQNMLEQNLNIDDYDVIFCEGFYLQEMVDKFNEEIFSKLNSDVSILFEERTYSKVYGNKAHSYNLRTLANIDISDVNGAKYVAMTLLSDPKGTPLGFLEFLIPALNEEYQTVLYHDLYLYYPSGLLFHPAYPGKYFETFEDYKAWYESSYHVKLDANGDPKPYIGVFGFYSVYKSQLTELTTYVEAEGYNVVAGYDPAYDEMDTQFVNADGSSAVAAFISMKNWAMNYWSQPEGVRQLENLNVPVIKAIGSSGWGETTGYDENSGIPASTFTWMASSSNVDGMIDFIGYNAENKQWIAERAVAWANLNATDNIAKEIAIMYYNYPPGKEEIGANYLNVMRSLAGDGAKERVAAGNSDIAISDPNYEGILRELRDQNYNISFDNLPYVTLENGVYKFDYTVNDESLIMNEENLIRLIYNQGINVGAYAPGVLNEMVRQRIEFIDNGGNPDDWWGAELIPVKDYLEWLEHETTPTDELTSFGTPGNGTMDSSLYDELIKTWGVPTVDGAIPGKDSEYESWGGMIWNDEKGEINSLAPGMNYIVIPMVKIGDNVRLMPQPNRALASDKALDSSTYHSGDLPPTHQYVAFYFWLNRGTGDSTGSGETGVYGSDRHWKADAVIHFGTHGTQEWLPGTSVGLYRTHDWGPVLLPNLPNIYPYIIANVGEGLTAEYRGNALIISHMTPPMVKTTVYDQIIDMETAIRGYQKQSATGIGDSEILAAYRAIIMETLFEIGWEDAFSGQFNSYKEVIVSDKIVMNDGKTRANTKSVTNEDIQFYLTTNKVVFDTFLEDYLHNFVEAIRETSLSYGTHVYGDFDSKQVIPMVWNMWSRQGLEDVFLDTYFKDLKDAGVTSIPSTTSVNLDELFGDKTYDATDFESTYTEDNISDFVEMAFASETPSADTIRSALRAEFGIENETYENQVILFLLGPAGYITMSDVAIGADNSAKAEAVVDAWKRDGIYDEMVGEFFEFYHYFEVAAHLRTLDETPENSKYRSSNMEYLDMDKMETQMVTFVKYVLDNTPAGLSPSYSVIEKGLSNTVGDKNDFSRYWYNEQMVHYVRGNNRVDYVENLRAVGDSEMSALINALNGGYISPSSGNDPVLNPYVLPTGRNFVGIDPSTYSTPAAWRVGQAMGEQLLSDYYSKYNEFPTTVSFQRFGVDFIQDEGTLEACLFYLLGCEPTWSSTGTFTGAKPIVAGDESYEEMFKLTVKNKAGKEVTEYRPRVDVVYNSAGMRDGYGSMLRYIDKAVKAVNNLDETKSGGYKDANGVVNNVKKNVDELIALNIPKDIATARVFAQELGNYEIGTGNLISASGNLPDPSDPEYEAKLKEIADTYLTKMGFLYTEDNWGQSSEAITKLLQTLLGRTDASIFASAGNLYDSVDNDDVFQYFGVMNMVSSMYDENGNYISGSENWKTPEMYIADTSNIHQYKDGKKIVYTAAEYIQKDLAARYLNEKWIQGQMEAGYSGATMMAEFIENLYGWSVISNGNLIGESTWDKVFEMYTSDEMNSWLSHTSPYALQSINARMVEAMRTGMWSPNVEGLTPEEVADVLKAQQDKMDQLIENYVKSVLESGVACCHHTCGNPTFDSFVQGMLQTISLDVLSDEEKEKYLEIVKDATEPPKKLTESKSSGTGVGMASVIELNADPDAGEDEEGEEAQSAQNPGVGLDGTESGTPTDVSGFEMTISRVASSVRDFIQNPTFSTSSIIAIAFVVLVVGAIFYGFRRKNV